MKFYSLHKKSPSVDFREATIRGLAPDKGLYFPEAIPRHDPSFFKDIESYTDEEIAYRIIEPYAGDVISAGELRRIVAATIDFPFPLQKIRESLFSLELYHGPTLAFKDVGAKFMSRCLGYFVRNHDRKVTVLVATSGDTGGAVASGFYNVEGVEVVILFPSGKVSRVQEKQLVTWGHNIQALEVAGSFDDCQHMVKQAFLDEDLRKKLFLTSANSINVARWLPQQFYYLFAWKQWPYKNDPPVISVPSGNFGNICAGLLAHFSGMPARHFIAACNANSVVPAYLETQQYQPKPPIATISNAMDVGDPSNFVRILELFHHHFAGMKTLLSSASISDEVTKQTIQKIFSRQHYLLDPHGAVAYHALESFLEEHPGQSGYFLETAHPVKFYDVVEPVTGHAVEIPPSLEPVLKKEDTGIRMDAKFEMLKEFLMGKK